MKTLVLFDFDGTITTKDTFPLFLIHTKGKFKTISVFALYSPLILLYFFKAVDGETLKRKIFSILFKGISKMELEDKGNAFVDRLYKNKIIKQEFVNKISDYKKKGAEVCVVSASIDAWMAAFCKRENIGCLCTELAYTDSIFKGEFKTRNCSKEQKAIRIRETFNLKAFDKIIAYGNSSGDKEMFELATEYVLIQ